MSGDYLTFEGRIEPLVWGKVTYTILPLPAEIAQILTNAGAKRVEGEINDHPVNLALTRLPQSDEVFLWAGKSLLDQVDITPGETIEIRLRPALDDHVNTPNDLSAVLLGSGLSADWEALTPGKKRGLLYQINTAKTAATRAKRITKLLVALTEDGR